MLGPNSPVSLHVKSAAANTLSATLWNGASGSVRCRLRLLQLHQLQCHHARNRVHCRQESKRQRSSCQLEIGKWRHQQPSTIRSGLLRATTLPASSFAPSALAAEDPPPPIAHMSTTPTTVMITLSDPPLPPGYGESSDMNCDSPNEMVTPTPTHSPSSTDSSSGDRTIQMSSFIDKPHRPMNNRIFAPMMPLSVAPATQKLIMTGDG